MPEPRSTALTLAEPAKLGLPAGPTTDAALVTSALISAAAAGANVLAPLTRLDYLPPAHTIAFRVVVFDARFSDSDRKARSNGTFYLTEGGKIALHRAALDQLASAAGMSTVRSTVSSPERFVWEAVHTVRYKGFDGSTREITRSKTVDLRDDSPEIAGWTKDRTTKARGHGPALAESKAANRCIRAALGIKGGYTEAEAARPFVFPVLLWTPDTSDPMIARMVAAKELGIVREVFGPAVGGPPAIEQVSEGPAYGNALDVELDDEPATKPAPVSEPPPAAKPAPLSEPPVPPSPNPAAAPEPPGDHPPFDEPEPPPPPSCSFVMPSGALCGKRLGPQIVKFCEDRLGGRLLCMDHQKAPAGGTGGRA